MYLPHIEEEAEEMIHITIARSVVGAAVRTVVRYGPTAYRAHKATRFARMRSSIKTRSDGGYDVYSPIYSPEERWWE